MRRNTMFTMTFVLGLVCAVGLLTPEKASAYGAAHVGYTRVGPNGGVYHSGTTVAGGPGGAYGAERTTAVGPGGGVYHSTTVGGVGYGGGVAAGGYHYSPNYVSPSQAAMAGSSVKSYGYVR